MSDLLDKRIQKFSVRDFSEWLEAGILDFINARPLPKGLSMGSVFPYAERFIGMNQEGIAYDLSDMYEYLESRARIAFRKGIAKYISGIEFSHIRDFDAMKILLTLACQTRAREVVEHLFDKVPSLLIAELNFEELFDRETRNDIRDLYRLLFQAAVELAVNDEESVACIEHFVRDKSFDERALYQTQALELFLYLSKKVPSNTFIWAAIFGDDIVKDAREGGDWPSDVRARIANQLGMDTIDAILRADQSGRRGVDAWRVNRLTDKSFYSFAALAGFLDAEKYEKIPTQGAASGDTRKVVQLREARYGT